MDESVFGSFAAVVETIRIPTESDVDAMVLSIELR